jgi:uncharacterized membrane protein (UPF0127 family)
MRVLAFCALAAFGLIGCGTKPVTIDDYNATEITLPDGTKILAETMRRQEDVMRGMMFRDALPSDRGMLFVHAQPAPYQYWMYQVRIPLDIIWLSKDRRVVEISAKTPPCQSKSAKECPQYGGHETAQYVLELNAGEAEKHNIRVGSELKF